jgi:hypothetical protein
MLVVMMTMILITIEITTVSVMALFLTNVWDEITTVCLGRLSLVSPPPSERLQGPRGQNPIDIRLVPCG